MNKRRQLLENETNRPSGKICSSGKSISVNIVALSQGSTIFETEGLSAEFGANDQIPKKRYTNQAVVAHEKERKKKKKKEGGGGGEEGVYLQVCIMSTRNSAVSVRMCCDCPGSLQSRLNL